jgi:eukaryotic-like serine/threonine-protein kinase
MPVPDKTAITRARAQDLVPGYKLEALVGKGGMGEVHKATQLSLGRTVAVKLLSGELAKDPAFVARFEKEAAALAALSHPHVVSIVDKGRAKETYFLVMEYVDGPSLREVMRSPLLDSPSALKISLEICRAIEYAHSRGVIHRDLKPENILFDEQAGGIPKVSDFGLAGFLEGSHESKFNVTETHVAMGTVSYMAPEQRVDAKTADHRADVYSLGVILYELLVGELPVGNFDPPSHRKPGLDKRLDGIIARCLKPVPADRYQKVADLIADLEPLVPVTATLTPRKVGGLTRASMVIKRVARNATQTAAALIVIAALIILAIAAIRARTKPSNEKQPGEAVASVQDSKGFTTAVARREVLADHHSLTLGDGPDMQSLVAFGRSITFEGGTVSFPLAERGAWVGRAGPDLEDFDGISADLMVDVTTQVPEGGWLTKARQLITGESPNPTSTLMLAGSPGRFVALSVFGNGAEARLEWSLADAKPHSWMAGPKTAGNTRLELALEKSGDVKAYVGAGKDRRLIGEALGLGLGWKHLFGGMPKPALGCIEGTCAFSHFSYRVESERPPEPPPPPPVHEVSRTPGKQPTVQAHSAPPSKKSTSSKKVESHSTSTHDTSKKTTSTKKTTTTSH